MKPTHTTQAPHMGQLLKKHIRTKRLHRGVLAKLLGKSYNTVYNYQNSSNMQTGILWELCQATKHNFFADLAAQLPADFTTYAPDPTLALQEELEQLREENKLLRTQVETLKEVMRKG